MHLTAASSQFPTGLCNRGPYQTNSPGSQKPPCTTLGHPKPPLYTRGCRAVAYRTANATWNHKICCGYLKSRLNTKVLAVSRFGLVGFCVFGQHKNQLFNARKENDYVSAAWPGTWPKTGQSCITFSPTPSPEKTAFKPPAKSHNNLYKHLHYLH